MNADEISQRANEIAESAAAAAWWSAAGTILTTVLTIGLLIGAVLAWKAAKAAVDQAKATHEQMQKDSIEQTRPYVYARLVPGIGGIGAWDLLVTNTGRSTARRLTIESDTWPDSDDVFTRSLRTMFSTEQSLPPGATLRAYWKVSISQPGHKWDDGTSDPKGMAKGATLTLYYTSDDASKPVYEDQFRLDDSTIGETPGPYTGPDRKKGLTTAQQDLHNVLAAIAANVAELRR